MTPRFRKTAGFIFDPQVPAAARQAMALLLLDTIGVAAGAAGLEPARLARTHAAAHHGAADPRHQARMMFDGRAVSVPGAAFAAATQIDNLDGHDGYNPTKGHIGCAVIPALFAFAENHPDLSMRDALDLLVMSYEVSARAAIALHRTVSDYHTSGAWNALGVAAIGCRLRNATPAQLREALGIAEYHGPRSQMMREIATPTMLHDGSGMGALTGAMAALLAVDGFKGAPAITVEDPGVADIWDDLGHDWTVSKNYIKPYPVCRWAHAPLDALSRLMRDHTLACDDIRAVQVNTFAQSAALYSGVPETTGIAQYSLPFALAIMMRHGQVGPAHIAGAGLADISVARLLPRISVTALPEYSARFPAQRCADVTVTLQDGTTLASGFTEARGGPEAPLSTAEIGAKFHAFAAPEIGAERAAQIWALREPMTQDAPMRFSDLAALVTDPP
ncbi:MmgE/PrpD family protein [Roseobacter ponti]|uniref:MmgE/PrpD family protein n=1 Tax=Roseobacter ponti TaxID=1891787 RepID=A0A858SX17_9RHOB|nr:MmgE/PrpD family protein [Roseobacter ponti]QJF52548.1 MmgE/PrpD family protein [Roseobacter ponti]